MDDLLRKLEAEVAALERQMKADPKEFYGTRREAGGGNRRAESAAIRLEDLTRRLRGIVVHV